MHREVAEIEILISDFQLPAKLHDLPGVGSTNPIHDQIAHAAMSRADAFIYVANSTPSLSDAELGLIRSLYSHYKAPGGQKKIIWVVTAIDRAQDIDPILRRPGWEATVEDNEEFLREHFRDEGFLGTGFIPVSPALEAQGLWEMAQGDAAKGNALLARSGMSNLRRAVEDLIEGSVGRERIAGVAQEARSLVQPRYQQLKEVLSAERLPVDRLENERAGLASRIDALDAMIEVTRERLQARLEYHVGEAGKPFAELARHLHRALDGEILEAELYKAREENRIEVRQTQVLREWMTSDTGPSTLWDSEFARFREGVLGFIRSAVRDSDPTGELEAANSVDLEQLSVRKPRRSGHDDLDLVRAAVLNCAAIPLAGVAVSAAFGAVVIGGLTVLVPVGVTLGAGIYRMIKTKKIKEKETLDALRREWIDHLDEVARQQEEFFTAITIAAGSEIISRAHELLTDRADQLTRGIVAIEHRLSQSENVDRQELVARLASHGEIGHKIILDLVRLGRAGVPVRPGDEDPGPPQGDI